ncbi:MAG: type II toxin-antitoxin system RelE/ParE family toxin, partial [Acidobacteriota bacterium]
KSPVWDFIFNLPAKDQAKMVRALDLLEEFGLELRAPYVKSVTGHRKLWELRVRGIGGAYRILYFAFTEQRMVMLHAFAKKTRKTPGREIAMAEKRMDDFLRRHEL